MSRPSHSVRESAIRVISRKSFWLELAVSDTLGRLKPNQVVITDKGLAS
jgi:hypothetical protein